MDKRIKKVLEKLETNGFQAYLVGGFVRDYLIGKTTHDVDIATDALPKDIHKLFNSNKSNYGSVNLKIEELNVDITTFRQDLNYVKRKPSEVKYIKDLKEDLLRRDFTINAICMDKSGKVIDYVGGCEDLNNRLIRVIGDADQKIQEDPLRILRAIRFASVLDFDLDKTLKETIQKNSHLVTTLSKERIKKELEKILMSKNYLKGLNLLDKTGISSYLGLQYSNINYVDDLLGMWSQIKISEIPFTNNEKRTIINITEVLNEGDINNLVLYKYGLYVSTLAGKILNINPVNINKMYKKLPIKSREDIDISSKQLLNLVDCKKINETFKVVEEEILKGNLRNKRKDIIKFIEERK